MGRLIDADKLLETLQNLEPHCENKDYQHGMLNMMRYYMPKIINDEPTAYDVDKVVEQLEYQKNIWNYDEVADAELVNEKRKAYTMAIKIVKGGRIE